MTPETCRTRAVALLHQMLGPTATFRDGQLTAIESVVADRKRTLVVQRTGWGKSLVYFIASRMLRDEGAGVTLLVSPLLSLMRDQVAAAARIGLRAARIDSSNADAWPSTQAALSRGEVDVLLVSPERLANHDFMTNLLPAVAGGLGLLVVDEAHCISDWGHDFRPDYRRIVRIVRELPPRSPLLATTATANARVVTDIASQFGPDLHTIRGPLARASLAIEARTIPTRVERMAWLAAHLPRMPGTGIVYCLTKRDCEMVSEWLSTQGIDAPAYHAGLEDGREELERRLLDNDVKALVATVALGMGFDKPDLGFVVHFQRPTSLVAYYQQIGRAGRAVDHAVAVVLEGNDDDRIAEHFITSAFPSADEMIMVRDAIGNAPDGLAMGGLRRAINLTPAQIERTVKLLEVDSAIYRADGRYYTTPTPWRPDRERPARVTQRRHDELARMRAFMRSSQCLMAFVTRELDDDTSGPCGRCASCLGRTVVPAAGMDLVQALVTRAKSFTASRALEVEPRKMWPTGGIDNAHRGGLPANLRAEPGRALSVYNGDDIGAAIARAKYHGGELDDEIVRAAAEGVRRWQPQPAPAWLTCVPSSRRPEFLPAFARRLAGALGLPYRDALRKARVTEEQKTMQNSHTQATNVVGAFAVVPEQVLPGPVLLIDDIVNSRWTLTVCAMELRAAGSGAVFPFALAQKLAEGD